MCSSLGPLLHPKPMYSCPTSPRQAASSPPPPCSEHLPERAKTLQAFRPGRHTDWIRIGIRPCEPSLTAASLQVPAKNFLAATDDCGRELRFQFAAARTRRIRRTPGVPAREFPTKRGPLRPPIEYRF